MTQYIHTETLEIKSQGAWRKHYNNVVLPKVWTPSVLEAVNLVVVLLSPKPTVTDLQSVRLDGAVKDSLGNYVQNYTIVDKFEEYTDSEEVVQTIPMQQLAALRISKMKDVRSIFREKAVRPTVVTSLGFTMQGGYEDLQSLEVGALLGSSELRDIDNVMHIVTPEEFAQVIIEVRISGGVIKRNKWTLEATIKNPTTTLEELQALDVTSGWGV